VTAEAEAIRRRLATVVGVLLIVGLLAARLVPPPAIVLSLPFLYLLARKPVLRRLAFGHITRRPRETALVLLGSLLGTAIITGSFVVGDTLDASISQGIYTQLGPVDSVVPVKDRAFATVEQALAKLPASAVDGVLPITTARVTVATAAGAAAVVAEPNSTLIEVDFARASGFGGDARATGIEGSTPRSGEAVVGEDLAATLDVGVGDTVRVFAYGAERPLQVTRILDQRGIAGLQLNATNGSASPTIFVEPGFATGLAGAAPGKGEPPFDLVAVSAAGGVTVNPGPAFDDAIKNQLAAAGLPDNSIAAKDELRRAAAALGDSFTELFGMIGLFSVFAGVLLLVNIFVMLAQERQSELGMLRAVGLRRIGLVGSFSLEGWMYAIGSAALGTLAGLGVGRIIVTLAAGLFAGGGPAGQGALDLVFTASRSSASTGFLIGFVISLVTVVGTSIRISRLNVIRAIRDLPEPTVRKRRAITLVFGALGVLLGLVMTAGGIQNERAESVLVGPCVIAIGAVPLLTRFLSRRLVVSVASTATLTWAVFVFAILPGAFSDAAISVFLVQGIVLVASAVALLSQNQVAIGRAIRAVAGGTQRMALRLGLAYPLARAFRTSMTLAMYALVVYVLATITIFSSIFGGQIDSFTRSISGGFDLIAESNGTNPIPLEEIRTIEGVETIAPIASAFGEWTPVEPPRAGQRGAREPTGWAAASFDESFIAHQAPELGDRPAEYATDADAYRAVLANPDLFIPTGYFLQQGGGPPQAPEVGAQYVVRDTLSGRSRTLTVAAVAQAGFGNTRPLMSPAALQSIFGDRALANVFYIDAKEGVAADRLAAEINGRFIANGANAKSFGEVVQENLSQQQGFFQLMRGYLALGLVVGIAGLGVVMVRAVRERRREIGVLRALGFDPAAVRRAFLVESGFVAMEGILTGTVLAVVTTWRLAANADFGATMVFTVPWGSLVLLVLATIVASLLATATPAQQAARIKPAIALRIAD
jgi:putative ABC transport system permease protein